MVRSIIQQGRALSAVDAFRGLYRLAELKARARQEMAGLDALMVPTMPTVYTLAQVDADPVRLNSNLGVYTNFVNLLDMCGLAVPSEIRRRRRAVRHHLAGAGRARCASCGNRRGFHARTGLAMGATGRALPLAAPTTPSAGPGRIEIALFGAHLSGLPLNGELLAAGGTFVRQTRTNADYRLYLLPEGRVRRPGLLRGRPGERRAGRAASVVTAGAELRPVRGEDTGAARHWQHHPGRRLRGEGLPGRSSGGGIRARHHRLWRLARLPRRGGRGGRAAV